MMTAFGHTEIEIAEATSLARMTLRKHYGEDLVRGRAKVRGEMLAMLYKSAQTGNVSAQKHIEAMTSNRNPDVPYQLPKGQAVEAKPEEKVAKAKALGKKEQAALDAQNPDSNTPMGQLMAERHAEPKGRIQ